MNHLSEDTLRSYIDYTLNEADRDVVEEHLYSCDHCLTHYMTWIEINEQPLPNRIGDDDFIQSIMEELAGETELFEPVKLTEETVQHPVDIQPRPSHRHRFKPLVHYAIAASITLLLMMSGFFQGLTSIASSIDDKPKLERPSFTQNMMDRALHWMDAAFDRSKEGESL